MCEQDAPKSEFNAGERENREERNPKDDFRDDNWNVNQLVDEFFREKVEFFHADGGDCAENCRNGRRDSGNQERVFKRVEKIFVFEKFFVPLKRKAGKNDVHFRRVEAEGDEDKNRQEQEKHHECDKKVAQPNLSAEAMIVARFFRRSVRQI